MKRTSDISLHVKIAATHQMRTALGKLLKAVLDPQGAREITCGATIASFKNRGILCAMRQLSSSCSSAYAQMRGMWLYVFHQWTRGKKPLCTNNGRRRTRCHNPHSDDRTAELRHMGDTDNDDQAATDQNKHSRFSSAVATDACTMEGTRGERHTRGDARGPRAPSRAPNGRKRISGDV